MKGKKCIKFKSMSLRFVNSQYHTKALRIFQFKSKHLMEVCDENAYNTVPHLMHDVTRVMHISTTLWLLLLEM